MVDCCIFRLHIYWKTKDILLSDYNHFVASSDSVLELCSLPVMFVIGNWAIRADRVSMMGGTTTTGCINLLASNEPQGNEFPFWAAATIPTNPASSDGRRFWGIPTKIPPSCRNPLTVSGGITTLSSLTLLSENLLSRSQKMDEMMERAGV